MFQGLTTVVSRETFSALSEFDGNTRGTEFSQLISFTFQVIEVCTGLAGGGEDFVAICGVAESGLLMCPSQSSVKRV